MYIICVCVCDEDKSVFWGGILGSKWMHYKIRKVENQLFEFSPQKYEEYNCKLKKI